MNGGTKIGFLGDLVVSPYGVVTRDRKELEPFRAARTMFSVREEVAGQ